MNDTSPNDRLAAHERLSTGALAAWARRCATHPWRVVGTWIGIIVLLIVLVATIGGTLRDEFTIPGSDTQKRDRPDQGRVRQQAGLGAQHRLRRAARAAARHARAQGGDRGGGREAQAHRVQAEERQGPAWSASTTRSVPTDVLEERPHRLRRGAVQQGDHPGATRSRSSTSRTPSARRRSSPRASRPSTTARPSQPPIKQGLPELLGFLAAIIVLLIVFRTFVAMLIPILLAHHGAGDRVPPALHPRRADRHQHDHADPRLDDRPRRRHRLLALHRHALQAAAPRRPLADGRGRRGRRRRRAARCSSPA